MSEHVLPSSEGRGESLRWAERLLVHGLVPDAAVRVGIRHLLRERLRTLHPNDSEAAAALTQRFLEGLREAPLALLPEKANAQHYELPPALFEAMLGPQDRKSVV